MNRQELFPGFRLAVAGLTSVLLLAGVVFPLFSMFGSTFGRVVPLVLCIFILVILIPVVLFGSWRDRALALSLAVLPALLLAAIIVSSFTFPR